MGLKLSATFAGVKNDRAKKHESTRGNPYIHTGKSVSLSPPDKSPLDKRGQAGQEPSFNSEGVQDGDKDESPLGEMWELGKRPQAEKLSQQLWLPKPLKKFTHQHSTNSANIG